MFAVIFLLGLAGFSAYTWIVADGPKVTEITDYSDLPHVGLGLKQNSNAVSILTTDQNHKLTFSSNTPAFLEPSASYRFLSLSADMPTHGGRESNTDRNIDASIVRNNFSLELFFHKNQGFELADSGSSDPGPAWARNSRGRLQRDDLTVTSFGFNVMYVFLPGQFSPEAAFNFSKRQTIWGWSPFMMLSQDAYSLESDAPLIPTTDKDTFSSGSEFTGGLFTTTTLSGGWGVLIPYRDFFINYDLIFGMGPELRRYNLANQIVADSGISQKAYMNIVFGYSDDSFATGLEAKFDSKWSYTSDFALHYENNIIEVFATKRL